MGAGDPTYAKPAAAALREAIEDPARLAAVAETGLLGSGEPDPGLLRLAREARRLLDVPTVSLNVVDDRSQHFAAADGLSASLVEAGSTPLSHAFCLFTVGRGRALVVSDARRHEDLCDNPAIAEFGTIAYAGVPVVTPEGQVVGALCATDSMPRFWPARDVDRLRDIARTAALRLEQRREEL